MKFLEALARFTDDDLLTHSPLPSVPLSPLGEMAQTKTQFLLLALLLGLWVAEVPVSAKPHDMTSSQWFETQHVQPSLESCNTAMRNINKYTKRCKSLNTFIHSSFSNVAATCEAPNVTCKNGRENCHLSQEPAFMTMCDHVSGRYPDCNYKEKYVDAYFIVACDPAQQTDYQGYELVPVHFDEVV
ncbi:PREDICTED: ribonuclease 8 [Elephantulus edwardii]|uniref:ribonuclease 8 n=1 Tax=Elephantulus edwardii TaxID=28737 RepID=UPI0003F0822C|nr:PREDICTED: ribonuclease 8 [Elephantulus edwardii]